MLTVLAITGIVALYQPSHFPSKYVNRKLFFLNEKTGIGDNAMPQVHVA